MALHVLHVHFVQQESTLPHLLIDRDVTWSMGHSHLLVHVHVPHSLSTGFGRLAGFSGLRYPSLLRFIMFLFYIT